MSSTNASASDKTRMCVSGQLNVRERSQKCFCAVCTFLRELTRLSNRVYTPCRGDKLATQHGANCAFGSDSSVLPNTSMLYRWRT